MGVFGSVGRSTLRAADRKWPTIKSSVAKAFGSR